MQYNFLSSGFMNANECTFFLLGLQHNEQKQRGRVSDTGGGNHQEFVS